MRLSGEGGIRTLDTSLSSYNGLANRPFRPLRHLSKKGLRVFSEGEAKIKIIPVGAKPGFQFFRRPYLGAFPGQVVAHKIHKKTH
jgi:hypothetical protein